MEIREYDSLEDAFEDMRKATEWANAHLAEAQRQVTWGSHWVRFYDIPGRILIFGKVDTLAEVRRGEESTVQPGEDPAEVKAEIEYSLRSLAERHENGYLYGQAYSIITPDGEYGDTHRANLWPIPAATFEAARSAGWQMDALDINARHAIAAAYAAWGRHQVILSASR